MHYRGSSINLFPHPYVIVTWVTRESKDKDNGEMVKLIIKQKKNIIMKEICPKAIRGTWNHILETIWTVKVWKESIYNYIRTFEKLWVK